MKKPRLPPPPPPSPTSTAASSTPGPQVPRAASPARRPIFKKSPRVLFWGPGVVKIGFLAKNSTISLIYIVFDRFLKNQHFRKTDFSKIGYFFTFYRYFEAWEHKSRTRHEKILLGSYSEIFKPDGKLIGARRRSKISKR